MRSALLLGILYDISFGIPYGLPFSVPFGIPVGMSFGVRLLHVEFSLTRFRRCDERLPDYSNSYSN